MTQPTNIRISDAEVAKATGFNVGQEVVLQTRYYGKIVGKELGLLNVEINKDKLGVPGRKHQDELKVAGHQGPFIGEIIKDRKEYMVVGRWKKVDDAFNHIKVIKDEFGVAGKVGEIENIFIVTVSSKYWYLIKNMWVSPFMVEPTELPGIAGKDGVVDETPATVALFAVAGLGIIHNVFLLNGEPVEKEVKHIVSDLLRWGNMPWVHGRKTKESPWEFDIIREIESKSLIAIDKTRSELAEEIGIEKPTDISPLFLKYDDGIRYWMELFRMQKGKGDAPTIVKKLADRFGIFGGCKTEWAGRDEKSDWVVIKRKDAAQWNVEDVETVEQQALISIFGRPFVQGHRQEIMRRAGVTCNWGAPHNGSASCRSQSNTTKYWQTIYDALKAPEPEVPKDAEPEDMWEGDGAEVQPYDPEQPEQKPPEEPPEEPKLPEPPKPDPPKVPDADAGGHLVGRNGQHLVLTDGKGGFVEIIGDSYVPIMMPDKEKDIMIVPFGVWLPGSGVGWNIYPFEVTPLGARVYYDSARINLDIKQGFWQIISVVDAETIRISGERSFKSFYADDKAWAIIVPATGDKPLPHYIGFIELSPKPSIQMMEMFRGNIYAGIIGQWDNVERRDGQLGTRMAWYPFEHIPVVEQPVRDWWPFAFSTIPEPTQGLNLHYPFAFARVSKTATLLWHPSDEIIVKSTADADEYTVGIDEAIRIGQEEAKW